MGTAAISLLINILSVVFQNEFDERFHGWKIKRLIKRTVFEFSKHIIWADMREQNVTKIEQIASSFNLNTAYKIIYCYQEYTGSERDNKLEQLINIWLGWMGINAEKDREFAIKAFQLFTECIMKVREKCISDDDRLLKSMIEQSMKCLTEEIKQEINKQDSISKFIENRKEPWENRTNNFFDYRSEQVPFCGREVEFAVLSEFCSCDGDIKWWSVIAPGGSGKSRLALEFCKALKGLEWDCLFLNHATFNEMLEQVTTWQHSKNLLIVVDYVSINSERIGAWLRRLSSYSIQKTKIRILLLERNGFVDNKEPIWYENIRRGFGGSGSYLDEFCFTREKQHVLEKLTCEDRKLIVQTVIKKQRSTISKSDVNKMLEMLEEIDSEGQRPLFLLFIVQAYLDKEINWRNWNREELQQHIYKKEISRIEAIVRENRVCVERAKLLWALATLSGPFNIESIKHFDIFRCNTNQIANQGLTESTLRKQMKEICCEIKYDVVPYVPDIAGEFYLLETFQDIDDIEEFIKTAWEQNSSYTASTLDRLYIDFRKIPKYQPLLQIRKCGLFTVPHSIDGIIFYAILLTNITSKADNNVGDAENAVAILKELKDAYSSIVLLVHLFSDSLFNLSILQNVSSAESTIHDLVEFSRLHKDKQDIQITCADGLFNLISRQEVKKARITIRTLRTLAEENRFNNVIIARYSQGLLNLSIEQEFKEAKATMTEIGKLVDSYNDNEEIAVSYTMGLFSLYIKNSVVLNDIIVKISKLVLNHEDNVKIAKYYAQCLLDSCGHQNIDGIETTIEAINNLRVKHKNNEEIAVIFARSLVVLSNKQNVDDAELTIEKLKKLAEEYKDNEEMTIRYAKGLIVLSSKQEVKNLETTIDILRELSEKHESNEEVADILAHGIIYLIRKDTTANRNDQIKKLKRLSEQYNGNIEILDLYTDGLVYLIDSQTALEADSTIKILESIAEKYDDNNRITLNYVQGLLLLCGKQNVEKEEKTIIELRRLALKHKDNYEIVIEYAKALIDLISKQDIIIAETTVEELQKLAELHMDSEIFLVSYAQGLSNIYHKQEGISKEVSLEKLRVLTEQHKDNQEIMEIYKNAQQMPSDYLFYL